MYWHDVLSDALLMYKREGRLALDVGDTGLRRGAASSARAWASCSTRSTGRSTRAGSGRATARRARSSCASARASRWSRLPAERAMTATRRRSPRPRAAPRAVPRPGLGARATRRRRASPASCAAGAACASSTSSSRARTSAPRAARLRQHSHVQPLRLPRRRAGCTGASRSTGQPPNENDWAKVDVFKLKDGRELRGTYGSRTGGPIDRFYPLRGTSETVPAADIVSRSSIRYVSFPPFPAVLMAPLVAIWGLALQRRPLHGAVGGAQPGAAVLAAARSAPARALAAQPTATTCG